jgi:hypothetical protein
MNPILSIIEGYEGDGNPEATEARAELQRLQRIEQERDELKKLLARVDVAFRCNLSQPEANDYYWRVREAVTAALS